jgi:hypothetical protein
MLFVSKPFKHTYIYIRTHHMIAFLFQFYVQWQNQKTEYVFTHLFCFLWKTSKYILIYYLTFLKAFLLEILTEFF